MGSAQGSQEPRRFMYRHTCLPFNEIVGMGGGRARPPIARRKILEKLDAWACRRSQCRDSQMRSEDVIQMLLLRTPVLAFSSNREAEDVAPEVQTCVGVGDHDGRVVDAEKESALGLPPWLPLARRKLEDFQGVAIRVLEVEGTNPARRWVPI